MVTLVEALIGEVGSPAFPEYPQFTSVPIPEDVVLNKLIDGKMVPSRVTPTRAWQGVIKPFENDGAARRTLRLLALNRPVDVLAGQIIPPFETNLLAVHPGEGRLSNCDIAFDLLVLEFVPPAHPWVFSLSPAISRAMFHNHPHLRTDRIVRFPSRTLHAFCIYSAAEFAFDPALPKMPQLLNQAAIYLAKHIIWQKTQRLFNINSGEMIHDGLRPYDRPLPPNSIWQIVPTEQWIGLWPGSVAANGRDHLKLSLECECWCGRGRKYKDCCRPEEEKIWLDR